MRAKYFFAIGLGIVAIAVVSWASKGLDETAFVSAAHPAIQYVDWPRADRAQKLAQDLESGRVKTIFQHIKLTCSPSKPANS